MNLPWRKVVLWGATTSLDSSRHIYRAYHEALRKLGMQVAWVGDEPASREQVGPGCLVFAFDVWGAHIGDAIPGVDYLLHNFDVSHPLIQTVEPEHLVRLQVFTDGVAGVQWDTFRWWLKEGHVLFQPWGTNLLAEEFLDPVFNAHARECAFVGAVWDDGGLGNAATIPDLEEILGRRGLHFTHLTQVGEQEMVRAIRGSRIAPALAGAWQVQHNYLPCRVFKNVSYGALAVTNVLRFADLMPGTFGGGVETVVTEALRLRGHHYLELVREQQRAIANYTYRDSLEAVARAFEEART